MITTDTEYNHAKEKLAEELKFIETQQNKMQGNGFTREQIKLATDPHVTFSLKLKEDIEEFKKLKNNETTK